MTEEQIKELETEAFSKGMQQGIIAGITLVITHCKKQNLVFNKELRDLIKFCESEIKRISEMNPIGE